MEKQFKAGDPVYIIATSTWHSRDYCGARKSRVRKVYKNGNFVLDIDLGQFRPNGFSTAKSYYPSSVEHETPELLQKIEHAKRAKNARVKSGTLLDKLQKAHRQRDTEMDIKIATVLEREFPELIND